MALTMTQLSVLAAAFICISLFCCRTGMADEYTPERGDEPEKGTGTEHQDPTQIVAKALLCFNDKYVYSSCEESYRLNESGDLKVPAEKTDEYCNGPCMTETQLVLDCIDNIMTNFQFYNKATIQDIRDTIHAGCGHGKERGKFDVTEHITRAEGSNAYKAANQILIGIVLMIVGNGLLF
ncbi:unnamed protein product [Malus baccata var. baccata]